MNIERENVEFLNYHNYRLMKMYRFDEQMKLNRMNRILNERLLNLSSYAPVR